MSTLTGSNPCNTCSPQFWSISLNYKLLPAYLHQLDSHLARRAYLLARVNSFPSSVSWGRFNQIPTLKRLCLHGCKVPDTLTHIVLECPAFSSQRALIQSYLVDLNSKANSKPLIIKLMLSEKDPTKLTRVADALGSMLQINNLRLLARKHSLV